jgi:hypothetical protein
MALNGAFFMLFRIILTQASVVFMSQEETNNFKYIGWVPCVSGQLCYSFIKCLLGKEHKKFTYNHKIRPDIRSCSKHLIALKSSIDWKDRPDKEADGDWEVYLVAKSVVGKKLIGNIFIYPTEDQDELSTVKSTYGLLTNTTDSHEELHTKLESELIDHDKSDEFYQINFEMTESGITTLKVVTNDESLSDQDEYVLCRQAFYFLKYSLHTHKHHSDTLDSLTTVHPIGGDKTVLGEKLIFDLKQSLVDINRRPKYLKREIKYNFTGIISYMKSLLEACKKEGIISDENYEHEINLIKNTTQSYQSGNDQQNSTSKIRFDARGESRQFLLLVFAILAPWVITARQMGGTQLSDLSAFLIGVYGDSYKSIVFIGCIFALYWLCYFASSRGVSGLLGSVNESSGLINVVKTIVHDKYKTYIIVGTLFLFGSGSLLYALSNIFG